MTVNSHFRFAPLNTFAKFKMSKKCSPCWDIVAREFVGGKKYSVVK
ncbi:predicted protein [Sclerotinia sclerotiorum 1980 UF-70]|uniref:Uncharacterized protein n=1 Tax=Sclerotinia sclerotiorum (strain ATCC 18683 / 1980 / Ss-1) TaxID=665079 RepID=A7EAZ3_SCLS1|nr:predicted protein [Sclerotinia sclerotiorum 1980 UF-70]EDN99621.1 predicted protein [Sclerotinia sclerotiorum 1980 UF-70]